MEGNVRLLNWTINSYLQVIKASDQKLTLDLSRTPITYDEYLTIIPRARMGSESIAQEAEGRMDYWLRGHEGERNNCFSKIQLVGQKYRE